MGDNQKRWVYNGKRVVADFTEYNGDNLVLHKILNCGRCNKKTDKEDNNKEGFKQSTFHKLKIKRKHNGSPTTFKEAIDKNIAKS